MGAIGKVSVDLEAKSAGFTKGIGEVGQGLSKFVKDTQGKFGALTFSKGFDAAGMARFGSALAPMAKEATDLATAVRTGASNSEVFGELINKIPIVGTFKQAGEAIRELITGEQAAVAVAEKLGGAAQGVSDQYRKMAREVQGFGLRGEARDKFDIVGEADARITGLRDKNDALQKQINEIEGHQSDLVGGGLMSKRNLTDAQEAQLTELQKQKDANNKEIQQAASLRDQKVAKAEAAGERDRFLFHRDTAQKIDAMEDHMAAVALRRQGDQLGAAKKLNESHFKELKRDVENQADEMARPYEKSAKAFHEQNDPINERKELAKAAAIRKDAADQVAALETSKNQLVANLDAEDGRRQQETALDNAEKLKEIQAKANVDVLRLKDEQINTANEKNGAAARSHLADAAQAEEDYRKQVADIEKKYRDPSVAGVAGADKSKAEELKAAATARDAALGLQGQKSRDEVAKNAETIEKEHRQAWESAGDVADKYRGKVEDITEQYTKFHDVRLRDKQIQNLDAETLQEIQKRTGDAAPKVDLYGRSSPHNYVPGNFTNAGGDAARQQLEEIKAQTQTQNGWTNWFRDIWGWLNPNTGAAATSGDPINI